VFSNLLSTTKGSSGIPLILCPRACTRAVIAEAARAEATAWRFYLIFTLLYHLLQTLRGANIRPFLHIFPNAAYPERWVPLPDTLGILATALPVPQDSAECFIPERGLTPRGWRRFLLMLLCTNYTISRRMGALKTPGRAILSLAI